MDMTGTWCNGNMMENVVREIAPAFVIISAFSHPRLFAESADKINIVNSV